jgi:hypothetical protein
MQDNFLLFLEWASFICAAMFVCCCDMVFDYHKSKIRSVTKD